MSLTHNTNRFKLERWERANDITYPAIKPVEVQTDTPKPWFIVAQEKALIDKSRKSAPLALRPCMAIMVYEPPVKLDIPAPKTPETVSPCVTSIEIVAREADSEKSSAIDIPAPKPKPQPMPVVPIETVISSEVDPLIGRTVQVPLVGRGIITGCAEELFRNKPKMIEFVYGYYRVSLTVPCEMTVWRHMNEFEVLA